MGLRLSPILSASSGCRRWGLRRSMSSQVPPIEVNRVSRVGLMLPIRVDRCLVESQPLHDGGEKIPILPGRVLYEAHSRRISSRTLPRLWQPLTSQVAEKRLCRVLSPLRAVHQSLPLRRMLRAPFPFSLCKGRPAPVNSARKTRLLVSLRPINIYSRQSSGRSFCRSQSPSWPENR